MLRVMRSSFASYGAGLVVVAGVLLLWPGLVRNLLVTRGFAPHGYCILWEPRLIALEVIANLLIGCSYVVIALLLATLVFRARQDIPFGWIFLAFGGFIIACGMTHFMDVLTLFRPMYWLAGYVTLVTAAASVATAVVLPPLLPKTFALISRAKLADQRQQQLASLNEQLQYELTERKRVEEAIQRLNLDLEQRVQGRTRELMAANKELDAYSYSIAHDLRAPVRSIDGFADALLEDYHDALDPQGIDFLGRIRDASQRMALMIDGLLQLARLSRGELQYAAVNLSAIAHIVARELEQRFPERTVVFQIADGLVVNGDSRLLYIVLENLLGNAWKFSSRQPQATIEFGATQQDGQFVYFVRDNGVGFNMAYVDKLFGPFQRLHRTEEFEGTGIGLANVQRILQRHGGRVWAHATPGHGATFYFTLL